MERRRDIHYPKPRVVSVTQATELSTVYTPEDLAGIRETCRKHGLRIHMDGARFANAVAALDVPPRLITWEAGVDVLCLGGTKNGMAVGEAVVFFDTQLAQEFAYRCKQAGQLASKMRFMAAQMEALLSNDLWRRNAEHANSMARLLEAELRKIPQVKIVYPVEANGVFAQIPQQAIRKIQERYFFYVWNEEESVVRWMCSFDTSEADVRQFSSFVAEVVR